jgi:ribonuclease R
VKVKVSKKQKRILNLQSDIVHLFDIHKRLTPKNIARHLELNFERGSQDRKDLTDILKKLTRSSMLVNNGGNYVQPFRAKPDASKHITGVVQKENGHNYVIPSDASIDKLPLETCHVPDGTIVTVSTHGEFNKVARIVSDHGEFDQASGISKVTALEAGIPIDFPEEVLREVSNLTVPVAGDGRKDMTHIPFLTIDPETAKDYDDAICVRKVSANKYKVMVAIADVAHYVKPGSATFDEAMDRGNSTYLPGYTIPMIPEELSNGLCSLKPNENRAAFVMTMEIDGQGNILKYDSTLAVIKSRARLTYEQVQEAIDEQSIDRNVISLREKYIKKAEDAYRILLTERHERGALDLNVKEQRIDITREGGYDFKLEQSNESHGLIEELMILANRAAFQTMTDRNTNIVVRSHGEPNEKLLREKLPYLEKLGMVIDEGMTAAEMVHDIAKQAKGHQNGEKIRQTLIRVQAMAVYQAKPAQHFALALNGYSHFTSPIRRGADLLVHHLMQGGQIKYRDTFAQEKLDEYVAQLNKTEKRSEEAERIANKRLSIQWVKGHLGEKFNAQVTSIHENEITVRVSHPGITTDISVSSTDRYAINQPIEIVPVKADPLTAVIDFKVVKSGTKDQGLEFFQGTPKNAANENTERTKRPRKRYRRADTFGNTG